MELFLDHTVCVPPLTFDCNMDNVQSTIILELVYSKHNGKYVYVGVVGHLRRLRFNSLSVKSGAKYLNH